MPGLGQKSDDVANSDLPMEAAEYLPASVQEDSDVTNSDPPVMTGEFSFLFLFYTLFIFGFFINYLELKVDRAISTHVAVRFSESLSDLEIDMLPHSKNKSKTINTMSQTFTSTYREIESGAYSVH